MSYFKKHVLRISLVVALTLIVAIPGIAQTVWVTQTGHGSKAGIELQIPSFDFIEADFPTSVVYLYSHFALSKKYTLKAELPLSHFSSNNFFGFGGSISDTDVGNPYIGVYISNPESSLGFDLGVRLPLASGNNFGGFTGLLAETQDFTPFIPDIYVFNGITTYNYRNNSGLMIKVGGGPQLVVSTNSDTELFAKYFGQVLYNTDNIIFGGGLTGQAIVTEGSFTFSDATIHGLGLLGSYDFSNMTLGGSLKFPLDDGLNDIVNIVLGINTSFSF